MWHRFAWAVATVPLLGSSSAPASNGGSEPCDQIHFGVTSEQELVERIGPPNLVQFGVEWDRYNDSQPAPLFAERDHKLVYAGICEGQGKGKGPGDTPDAHLEPAPPEMEVIPDIDFDEILRNVPGTNFIADVFASQSALAGPFGCAPKAVYTVRNGRILLAEWEYTRESARRAKAAVLADRRYEISRRPTERPWTANRSSATCSIGVMEEPEKLVWTVVGGRE